MAIVAKCREMCSPDYSNQWIEVFGNFYLIWFMYARSNLLIDHMSASKLCDVCIFSKKCGLLKYTGALIKIELMYNVLISPLIISSI